MTTWGWPQAFSFCSFYSSLQIQLQKPFLEIIEFAPSFVPSKLCLENQSLRGLAWGIYPANPNQRQLPCDLTWFHSFFFIIIILWVVFLYLFLFTSKGLFEAGYLFIYALLLSREPNCNLQKKKNPKQKRVCEGWWRGGGSQQIEVRERGATSLSKDNIKLISLWSQELM